MNIITIIFYSLTLLAIGAEYENLSDTKYRILLHKAIKAKHGRNLDKDQQNFLVQNTFYSVWSFVGLFSSQWALFFLLFVLAIIPKQVVLLKKIDALLSILVLLAIVLNKYHFHYHFHLNF